MRAVVVGMTGGVATWWLARVARHAAVRDRLRARSRTSWLKLPARVRAVFDRALVAAALDLDADRAAGLWATSLGVGGVLGYAFGGVALAIGGALLAALLPALVLWSLRHRHARRVAVAVPEMLERIASELRAGGTINSGIVAIAKSESALAPDFERVDARARLGAPFVDALRDWSDERSAPGVDAAAGALAMCTTVGGRSADALDGLATSLRDRLAVSAEADALSAQARMSAVVVGGGPVAYLAWSALVDPRSVHALLATTAGRACLAIGLVLEGLGALWMRRIVRSGSIG